MSSFAVTSKTGSLSLYKAFIAEAEERGIPYLHDFTPLTKKSIDDWSDLYFTNEGFTKTNQNTGNFETIMKGKWACAISCVNKKGKIILEEEWERAVLTLDGHVNFQPNQQEPEIITVSISEIASWKCCDVENIRIKL